MLKMQDMNEIELYLIIDGYGGVIWRMNHDMCDGWIPKKDWPAIDRDIESMQKKQTEAVRELLRIGVVRPLDENGKPTDEYWTWYRSWDKWKKDMSDEEWRKFNIAVSRGLTDEEIRRFRSQCFVELKPQPLVLSL